jgi:hypothetical protein
MRGQLHASATWPLEKDPTVSTGQKAGCVTEQAMTLWECLLPLPGIEPQILGWPTHRLVTTRTEVPRSTTTTTNNSTYSEQFTQSLFDCAQELQ